MPSGILPRKYVFTAARWIHELEKPDDELIAAKVTAFTHQPLITIVMPAYNSDPAELTTALRSVTEQSYANWELCIADDASSRSGDSAEGDRQF